MQGLARLMLNGIRIIRQTLDMAAQASVVLFQLLALYLQIAQVVALVLVRRQTILSKDNVVANHDGQQCRCARRQAASVSVESLADAADGSGESAKLRRLLLRFHFFSVDAWMQHDARGGIPFDTSFLR